MHAGCHCRSSSRVDADDRYYKTTAAFLHATLGFDCFGGAAAANRTCLAFSMALCQRRRGTRRPDESVT